MGYKDFILFPVFLIILSLIFKTIRKTYEDPVLQKYHRLGFWAKVLGCIAFLTYNVYLSPGDSIGLYQKEGANIYHLILHDSNDLHWLFQKGKYFDESFLKDSYNAGYFKSEANFMVVRIVAILSFVTFGSYAATSLLFAMIAFSGTWKLFLFFYEQYPQMHRKFGIAILFFPTFVFWSGGILKDTLCIASIGWITYSVYEIFYRKKHLIKNSIILFLFGYLLIILKIYILISYVPFFILFIILKNLQDVKIRLFRYLLAPILIISSILAFTTIFSSYDDKLGKFAAENITTSISEINSAFIKQTGREDAESNFNLGATFDGSFAGLIKIAPEAISTTFFRPFIWEAHKFSQLLAAIESLLLMYFTLIILIKSRIFGFIKLTLSDPLIMYCFFFSVVFALFVGASTLNFGTLVRYKIPCLPFYTISLFLIYEKIKENSIRKSVQKANRMDVNSISLTSVIS